MKVFKFYLENSYYAIASLTKELSITYFKEEISDSFTSIEEIPESQWDEKIVTIYEDNDLEKETWKESIRELIIGTETQMVFTNDSDFY